MDADDLIEKDMIERMVEVMVKENVDMIIAQHTLLNKELNKKEKCHMHYAGRYDKEAFREKVINDYFRISMNKFNASCGGKLLKSEIIKEHCLAFDPSLKYGEDILFTYEYIMKANKVYVIKDYYPYIYIKHKKGVMSKHETNRYQRKKYIIAKLKEISGFTFPAKHGMVYFYNALDTFYSFTLLPYNQNKAVIINEFKVLLNDKELISSFKNLDKNRLTKREKLLFYLFREKTLRLLLFLLRIRNTRVLCRGPR